MPEWGAFLLQSGQVTDSIFFGIFDENILLGYALAEIRPVGLGKLGLYMVG